MIWNAPGNDDKIQYQSSIFSHQNYHLNFSIHYQSKIQYSVQRWWHMQTLQVEICYSWNSFKLVYMIIYNTYASCSVLIRTECWVENEGNHYSRKREREIITFFIREKFMSEIGKENNSLFPQQRRETANLHVHSFIYIYIIHFTLLQKLNDSKNQSHKKVSF